MNIIRNLLDWKENNGAVVTKATSNVAGLQKAVAAVAPAAASATGPLQQMATAGLSFGPAGLAILGATSAMAGFTAAMGGAIKLLRDQSEIAEQLQNLSVRTGVAASTLSGLQLAFKEAGVAQESLGSGLKFLNRAISENDPALKALGITAHNAEEAFFQLADALAASKDPAADTEVAMKLLGRAGTELTPIMKRGGEELKTFVDRAKATGAVLSDDTYKALIKVDDAFDQMDRSIAILRNALVTALAPAFTAFVNFLVSSLITTMLTVSASMEGFAKALFALGAAFHVPQPAAAELLVASQRLSKTAVQLAKDFANVKTAPMNKELKDGTEAMRNAAAAGDKATKANKELLASLVGLATGAPEERQLRGTGLQRETDVEDRAKAALRLRESLISLSRATDAELKAIKGVAGEGGKITVPELQIGESFSAQVALFVDGLEQMSLAATSSMSFMNSAFEGFSTGLSQVFAQLTARGQTFSSALKTIFRSVVDAILAQLARLVAAQAFKFLLQILGLAVPGAGAAALAASVATTGLAGGTFIAPAGGGAATPSNIAPVQNNVLFQIQANDSQSFTEYMTSPLGRGYQSQLRQALMSPGF